MRSLLTLFALCTVAKAKVASCRAKIKGNENFNYCSKFSAPANSKVEIDLRSRFLNVQDPNKPFEDELIFYEVGVFSDESWERAEEIVESSDRSVCSLRRKLADQIL